MHWFILEEEGHVSMSKNSSVELILPCHLVVCRNETELITAYVQISASTCLLILPVLSALVFETGLFTEFGSTIQTV